MINLLLKFFLVIAFIELLLFFIVKIIKKGSLWIITEKDEYPTFESKKINKFFKNSFNKDLGWSRKPFSKGIENLHNKKTKFYMDKNGARKSNFSKNRNKKIAVFGDSFVFCRYVNDNQTWPEKISKKVNSQIMNFGVGNYGFDQALLKYKQTKLPSSIKLVIIGVVPETLARVHSEWKYFYEHGNIMGFKPKFYLKKKKLYLKKNSIKDEKSFKNINIIIENAKKKDIFYRKKFLKLKFTFPYLISSLHFFPFKIFLLAKAFYLKIVQVKKDKANIELFKKIYRFNINFNNSLYKNKNYTNLFNKLIKEFKKQAYRRNHLPLIIIFPQKYDLENFTKGINNYIKYFKSFDNTVPILDLTTKISSLNYSKLYFEDKYGGHLNNLGNRIVSKIILNFINDLFKFKY